MNLRRRGLTGFSLLMCLALAVSTHIHVVDVSETRMALQCFEDSWQLHGAMWTKDGQPLHEVSSASKLVIISDTNVTIDPVMPADEGVYRCNGGRRLGLTVPPYVAQKETVVMMQEIGSNFTLPCGIILGPISRSKTYEIEWSRKIPRGRVMSISSCQHSDFRTLDSPDQHPDDCNPNFNFSDFSLAINNFSVSDDDINAGMFQVNFTCIAVQVFSPSFGDAIHKVVETTVSYRYEPAAILVPLSDFTVLQEGDNLTLEIAFSGHPLLPQGIKWERNGGTIPNSRALDTETSSALHVSGSSSDLQLGDTITATVSVSNNSSASTSSTVTILSAIDDFTVARPSECNAPVLSLNLPSPIPVPPGSATAPNVQLHIEYTRINIEEQSGAGQVGGEEVFVMQYDARILTQSNHMQMGMESLPYALISWEAYVVRVRLEVLGVVVNHWSLYSRPHCIRCEECLRLPSVKINLFLSFSGNSYDCGNMGIEESLVEELVREIQASCPQYLCQDLELSSVEFSCFDNAVVQFSALASGVGAQDSVRAFLETVANQQDPLTISVNDTTVEVVEPTVQSSSSHATQHRPIAQIAGSSGGGLVVVLVMVALVLLCTVWQWRRCRKQSSASVITTEPETSAAESTYQPPVIELPSQTASGDLDLGLAHKYTLPESAVRGPWRPPTTPEVIITPHHHCPHHCHHYTHHSHQSPYVVPLTMAEAGNLVQNVDDETTSMDITQSEFSFISEGPVPVHQYHSPFQSYVYRAHKGMPAPPQSSGHRSRDLSLPLSQFRDAPQTPIPSYSCSCHSGESTPWATNHSPSPLLGSPQQGPSAEPRSRQLTKQLVLTHQAPTLGLHSQHQGHTLFPRNHHFVQHNPQARLESPV